MRRTKPASKLAPPNNVALAAPDSKTIEGASEQPSPERRAGSRNADGLTPKQEAFVGHHLVMMNATEAAKLAGYSPQTARAIGSSLLGKDNVATVLKRERDRVAERYDINADRVVRELARIAFSDIMDFMKPGPDGCPLLDFSTLSPDQSAVIQELTVEEFKDGRSDKRQVRRVKLRKESKMAALELLGKYLGLFKDQIQ